MCYQSLKLRYGCLSVCPALSAHRDVRGPDLIMVSLPPPTSSYPPPPVLEIVNTNTHTHPNKADQRKCSKNSSIHPSVALFEKTGFLPVCGDPSWQLILTKYWMSIWRRGWDAPLIDLCVVRVLDSTAVIVSKSRLRELSEMMTGHVIPRGISTFSISACMQMKQLDW